VNEQIARRDCAEILREELVSELKAFNVNRKRQTSDRSMPRSSTVGASNITTSDPVLLAEVQSIRRTLLALVEVGKAVSRIPKPLLTLELFTNCIRSTYATLSFLTRRLLLLTTP
jgi:hypothetical protein